MSDQQTATPASDGLPGLAYRVCLFVSVSTAVFTAVRGNSGNDRMQRIERNQHQIRAEIEAMRGEARQSREPRIPGEPRPVGK